MNKCRYLLLFICISLLISIRVKGQLRADFLSDPHPPVLELSAEAAARNKAIFDSLNSKAVRKPFEPRKATIRSAILPGWGQIYNKKYWKLPIVYGALGISAGVFFSNITTYNDLRKAIILRSDDDPLNDSLIRVDLQPLSTQSLTVFRNTFRQYIDYSVLAFLLLWGLNVVDATVDAHLKGFNVSPDLSLKVKPLYHFSSSRGSIGLAFTLEKRHRVLPLP